MWDEEDEEYEEDEEDEEDNEILAYGYDHKDYEVEESDEEFVEEGENEDIEEIEERRGVTTVQGGLLFFLTSSVPSDYPRTPSTC